MNNKVLTNFPFDVHFVFWQKKWSKKQQIHTFELPEPHHYKNIWENVQKKYSGEYSDNVCDERCKQGIQKKEKKEDKD